MTQDEKTELANNITANIESWLREYTYQMFKDLRDEIFEQVASEITKLEDES